MTDDDRALVAELISSQRVVAVRPWMVAELGLAAIWFAQLLWQMDRQGVDMIVRGDHEWEEETGLTGSQVFRARQKVAEKGWISVAVRKSAGTPKAHICLDVTRLAADIREVHFAKSRGPGLREIAKSFPLQEGTTEKDPGVPPVVDSSTDPSPPIVTPSQPRAEVIELCDLLSTHVAIHQGRAPKVTPAWWKDMDLLLRRGPTKWADPEEVSEERVRRAITFVFEHLGNRERGGFCWADQIRSPGALRSHWDQLVLAARSQKEVAQAPAGPRRPPHVPPDAVWDASLQEWI